MGLREDIDRSFRRLIREGVDNISDKEADSDFDDLDDKDIDNDGDYDESDEYLHNKLGVVAKKVNESSTDLITFSVDDEKLDQLLHDFHGRELDYVNDKKDILYTLPRREFDRFIDAADSKGFDVDYNESDRSVIYVMEDENLDEMSTTAGVPGYQTPYAFGDADEDTYGQGGMKRVKKTNRIFKPMESKSAFKKLMSEMYGIEYINEASNPTLDKAVDKFVKALATKNGYRTPDAIMAIFESLKRLNYIHPSVNYKSPSGYSIEEAVSYRDYKKDPTSTPQQKVNKGIAEVNTMLSEMEKIVANNLRLKTEMGVQSNHFWKSTGVRFAKINERMTRIANKLKELSQ
jgi:hypothetical protein